MGNENTDLRKFSFPILLTTNEEYINLHAIRVCKTDIINGITHTHIHIKLHIVRIIMILLHGTLLLSFHFF